MTTTSEVEALKARLLSSRERLLKAIAGVTEEQFKRRPEATPEDARPWSIAETLSHLLAAERLWSARIELALHDDGAAVAASAPAWNEEQAHAGRFAPVPQLVHGLLASQRQLERLIEQSGESTCGLERAVAHSTRGRLSVREMVQRYGIEVIDEHAARIEGLRPVVGAKAVD